jgi:hypothetical protein
MFCMVPGRTDEGEGMFAGKGVVDSSNCPSGCMQGCIEGIRRDVGITVKLTQERCFSTALPEVFRIMRCMNTVHLFKGGRFRNKRTRPGRDTGECLEEAGVALRVGRIFVTGTGRIDDN